MTPANTWPAVRYWSFGGSGVDTRSRHGKIPPFSDPVIAKISHYFPPNHPLPTPIFKHPGFWAVTPIFSPFNENTPLLAILYNNAHTPLFHPDPGLKWSLFGASWHNLTTRRIENKSKGGGKWVFIKLQDFTCIPRVRSKGSDEVPARKAYPLKL